ncbi:helix-turn-helix transcriptional regulator [Tamlana sp. 2201CG12-4]|uniref:helix-turn-helix domain-containing protein n=1 Tax=Tamlana sp. 2201CG12-4 TaxID=3112582 RepID=UPI002DBF5E4A|nr:helix-turn-helix transcriptional regulator [Tamlana sp. 2201CG12-4]MEC3906435.1 helix-turn-helix transcriptional regulator [Tamlana sp. 2201CG12-4]
MVSLKKKICNYIAEEWISKSKSNRQFAEDHAIDEKVVRRILKPEGSGISLTTLERICEAREIKISDFFQMIGE